MLFGLANTLVDRAVGLRAWAAEFCTEHGIAREEVRWTEQADGDGFVRIVWIDRGRPRPEEAPAPDRSGTEVREAFSLLLA